MNILKKLFLVLIVLASAFVGIWVFIDNQVPVSLVLLGFQMPETPLGVIVVSSFVAGILISVIALSLVMSVMAIRITYLKSKLSKQELGKKDNE